MSFDFLDAYGTILSAFSAFFNSGFFFAFKLFMAVYVAVLFIDSVLMLILYGFGEIRNTLYGASHPAAYKGQTLHAWKRILKRVETGDVSQFKVAILEADKLVDGIMDKAGYKGANMAERLALMLPSHVENKERLEWAHGVRNKIVFDETFPVNAELVREVLAVFRDFLKSWEAL